MVVTTLIILAAFLIIFAAVCATDLLKSRKSAGKYHLRSSTTAYLLLLPAVVLAFLFIMLPILYSLGYSFTDYSLFISDSGSFTGFDNFEEALGQIADGGELWYALKNTLIFVVGVVPLQILMALGLALFVNRKKRGVKFFKICFFAPVVISLSVTSFLWKIILDGESTGLINSFTGIFGAAPKDWLREDTAMLWIILLSAWQGCGYQMLIFISGLTNIRDDLYEAASLDGANSWQKFKNITWPGLRPTFVYILITVFIGACRVMIQPMLMVGYFDNVKTLSYYMYYEGITKGWVGYSSAIALLMTIVMGTVTLIQRKVLNKQ